jgi:hypothetical protein
VEQPMHTSDTSPRIASLDFQRDLALLLMVILHALEQAYDVRWLPVTK